MTDQFVVEIDNGSWTVAHRGYSPFVEFDFEEDARAYAAWRNAGPDVGAALAEAEAALPEGGRLLMFHSNSKDSDHRWCAKVGAVSPGGPFGFYYGATLPVALRALTASLKET